MLWAGGGGVQYPVSQGKSQIRMLGFRILIVREMNPKPKGDGSSGAGWAELLA